nr:putative ribonuclease H-like domain-containing protein [Tanacetum cinerariifolium]
MTLDLGSTRSYVVVLSVSFNRINEDSIKRLRSTYTWVLQTATVRAVDNEEQQIIAIVDGKEFTITEAPVRRHLELVDAYDEVVYKEWDDSVERATTTATSLDAAQDNGNIFKTQSTTMPNVPLPLGIGTGVSPRCQETTRGFIAQTRYDILLVQVYVDDIIFGSIKKSLCDEFEKMMHKRFQMSSTEELTFFLGLQVKQKDDGIFISQGKYVADILKKFDFITVKTASTLIEPNKTLIKDAKAEDVDVHLYRSMIGSLMYLTASRSDIMFAVCACARFQVTPKISHLHA